MPSLNEKDTISYLDSIVAQCASKLMLDIVELKVGFHHTDVLIHVLADRPKGGISIDECASLNQSIAAQLNEEKVILEDCFSIEVASPGLDRPLKTSKDFLRNLGYNIRLFLDKPVLGKKEVVGKLISVESKELILEVVKKGNVAIPQESVLLGKVVL